MLGQSMLWIWLAHSAVLSGLALAIGTVAVLACRQPVYRLRLIQWVLIGCLVAPWLHSLSPWTPFSLRLLEARAEIATVADADRGNLPDRNSTASESRRGEAKRQAVQRGTMAEVRNAPSVVPAPERHSSDAPSVTPAHPAGVPASFPAPVAGDRHPAFSLSSIRLLEAVLVVLYLVAVAGMCAFWIVGMWQRVRLERNARPASAEVLDVFREVAGRDADHVRVLVSDRNGGPITWGIVHPVIVVPSRFAENPPSAQMRWCLAHEWAHVERRDIGALGLASAAQLVCFYQPLFWWLKRQLILCQDLLADAHAARETDSAEDYAAFLLQLARGPMQRPAAAALGIVDGRSHLFRRVKTLVDRSRPVLSKCRPFATALIAAGALACLALLSTIRLDAANDSAVRQESATAKAAAAETVANPPTRLPSATAGKPETSPSLRAATPGGPASEPLNEPGIISGQVVRGDDGAPVPGVKVLLRGGMLYQTTSDKAGLFRFEKMSTDQYAIWAYKENLVSNKDRILSVKRAGQPGARFAPVRLLMHPGKQVKVTVASSVTGRPLEGAKIRFGYPDRRLKLTDKTGTALVPGLLAQKYEITIEASGHARVDREIDLAESGDVTDLAVALTAGGIVRGTVTDENGRPVSRALVSFREPSTNSGFYGESPWTGARGRFRHNYLPLNATVTVTVRQDDYLPQEQQLTLSAEKRERELNFTLRRRPTVSVEGTVTDQNGKPLAGATITNRGNHSDEIRTTTTDGKGKFALRDLFGDGTQYEIIVRAKGHAPHRQSVQPDSPAVPAHVDVKLERGHFIHGRVVGEEGKPLVGAHVSFDMGGFFWHVSDDATRTDDHGRFEFDSLPATCTFQIQHPGYSLIFNANLKLDAQGTVTVTLSPTATIRGRVIDAETGKPVGQFDVRVGPGSPVTFRSKDGTFTLKDLHDLTRYEVSVQADGYQRKILHQVVASGVKEEAVVDVALDRIDSSKVATLTGQIVDHNSHPVGGAQLRLIVSTQQPTSANDWHYNWYLIKSDQLGLRSEWCDQFLPLVSDSQGRFEFRNVTPGKFLQLAYWGDHVPQGRSLAFDKTQAGGTQSITIELPQPATINVTLDIAKFPNAGAIQAQLSPSSFQVYEIPLAAGPKKFEFNDLPPGTYNVAVMSKPVRSAKDPRMTEIRPLTEQRIRLKPGETKKVAF